MYESSPHSRPPRLAPIALDTNALDRNGTDRDALIDRFRALADTGQLRVVLVDGVRRELDHPLTPVGVREAWPAAETLRRSSPARPPPTAVRHIARIRVRAILRGDTLSDRHDADAAHLCDAAEAGCGTFLTHDKRFSRKRHDLEATLPSLRILGLREFFAIYDASETSEDD